MNDYDFPRRTSIITFFLFLHTYRIGLGSSRDYNLREFLTWKLAFPVVKYLHFFFQTFFLGSFWYPRRNFKNNNKKKKKEIAEMKK